MGCLPSKSPAPAFPPQLTAEWEWDDSRRMNYRTAANAEVRWRPFSIDQCHALEKAFGAGDSYVELAVEVAKGHGLRKTGEAEQVYTVDLQHFLQVNSVTGFVRRVRRRKCASEASDSPTRAWQQFPSKQGTHVYVGGLPMNVDEIEIIAIFDDHPDVIIMERAPAREDQVWHDASRTGRRRYCVVSWNGTPRPGMLSDAAASAVVGGKDAVVVVLSPAEESMSA